MGQTLKTLCEKDLGKSIFNNRFVVELCEDVHLHWRNLRIKMSLDDYLKFAHGVKDSLDRWIKRGSPSPDARNHVELCRKQIVTDSPPDKLQVNLNSNLYNKNKDKIYSEGANLIDDQYIHLKIRDMRIEMTINEFKELRDAIKEADKRFEESRFSALLQKA